MPAKNNQEKPVLAVTLGDAAGIGPELVAKIIADGFLEQVSRPIVIGDKRVLEQGMKVAGVSFAVNLIDSPKNADFSKGVQLIDTRDLDPAAIKMAEISAVTGRNAGDCIVRAMDYYKAGLVGAIVFAPFNKASLKKGGFDYESEHVLFANHFNVTTPYCEVNVVGDVMTSRVTSHIPISEVSRSLTVDGILGAITLLDATVRKTGVARPRLAVAGLNPHNGENGTCGREEIDIIRPAVEKAVALGVNAVGPFSADTVFTRALNHHEFDAIVTMYHDQGQIALKLIGFDQGVTVAGGIPAPIATPAHGTAFDIAGKNLARTSATKCAVNIAVNMAKNG